MSLPISRLAVVFLLAIFYLGCDSQGNDQEAEAGDVVLSERPALGPEAWTIGEEPLWVIGSGGTSGSGINLWRVRDALRLDDGRLLVAQADRKPILMFDSQGVFLRRISREGGGPAEFRGIRSIDLLPDGNLAAWGAVNRHVAVFDTLGRHLKTISHRNAIPELLTRADITSSLGLVARKGRAPSAKPVVGRRILEPVRYVLIDTLGKRRTVAEVPGYSFHGKERDDGRVRWARLLFGFISQTAEHDGRWVVGTSEEYEIQEFRLGPSSHPVRRIRWTPEEDRSVTEAHRADYLRQRATTSEDRSYQRSLAGIRDEDFNEVFPTHTALRFGRDGFLWARRFPRPGEAAALWWVFDPEGIWVTTVSLPADLDLLDAGEDYVLGLAKTDLDVEQIHLYKLQRK